MNMSAIRSLTFILGLCLCLLQSYLYAQDKSKVQFGKVFPADFDLPSNPIIDSSSHAVIISDVGNIYFAGNDKGGFSPVTKRQTRIKIIDKGGFEAGTVRILLYKTGDGGEKLDGLTATTYNLENGKVLETRLARNEIVKQPIDKDWTALKFILPAVREGSIIEYGYSVVSRYSDILQDWDFQSGNYPCLWSELSIEIPEALNYALVKQGIHGYVIDQGSQGSQSYKLVKESEAVSLGTLEKTTNLTANTAKHHWAMKEIPAFHVENYISASRNYSDRLEFQLTGSASGEQTESINTWKTATDEWLGNPYYFGEIREENNWLNGLMEKVVGNAAGQLAQAKAIYYYITGHFTCTDHSRPFVQTNLRDVLQKHSGTVGDLNMLMLAMFRKKNIIADPVLLSTKEYGFNFPNYPIRERFNYSIVRASIEGMIYYLDASHSQLGFGRLTDNCYNGHARIISEKDSGSIYFHADSLHENRTTRVDMTNSEKGGLEGSYQSTLGLQRSYTTREEISRIGEKSYFSNIQGVYGEDMQIGNTGIDSLTSLEQPIEIHYGFSAKQPAGASVYNFFPVLGDNYSKNPFQDQDRKYPIEMSYTIDDSYTLNMEMPTGYTPGELPKSIKVNLNVNEGSFEYLLAADAKNIQLHVRVKLDRARFPPEDYASLRDFFALIVKKEAEPIVFKKK
jgi:Transglutaminase-like superfamily